MKKKKRRKIRKKIKVRRVSKKIGKKIVFFVIDGLADLPINNKTPLTEAKKPNLDWLTRNGCCGELVLADKKMWETEGPLGSHILNLSLLGHNIKNIHAKRGPIEAVGANQSYENGWLAIRCNFATVDKDFVVLDRRAGRNFFGLDELSRYINEHVDLGVPFIFRRTFEHRAVLIIKKSLDDNVTPSDPYIAGQRVKRVEPLAVEANESAKLIQDFIEKSRQLIEFHSANEQRIKHGIPAANFILTRQAGNSLPIVSCFTKKHKINSVCIAENGAMKGTCLLAGFDSINVPELKVEPTLKFIFENIAEAMSVYDFVYVHVKPTDEAGHDGDFHLKRSIIEKIDEKMEMFRNFDGVVIVTCDHITACKTRRHEWGPVPILIYGKGKDKVEKFDEFSVKKGKLGLINGKKLWEFVFGK
jgi:2,3-bisphosphoglycerate-independent phosphoglycerate mutase